MAKDADQPASKLLHLPPALMQEIRDFRFEKQIASDTEAIRLLLRYGLDVAWDKHPTPPRRRQS